MVFNEVLKEKEKKLEKWITRKLSKGEEQNINSLIGQLYSVKYLNWCVDCAVR